MRRLFFRFDGPTWLVALALSSVGLVIVLAGAASGSFDPLGTALGLGAALAYTAYILVADHTGASRLSPMNQRYSTL